MAVSSVCFNASQRIGQCDLGELCKFGVVLSELKPSHAEPVEEGAEKRIFDSLSCLGKTSGSRFLLTEEALDHIFFTFASNVVS